MIRHLGFTALLTGLLASPLVVANDYADPTGRVARLSYVQGDISYSPVGEETWLQAMVNRPIVPGDRVWSADRSRAELQVGGAVVRLDHETSFEVLNLDQEIGHFLVTQGSVEFTVQHLYPDQSYEVATPTLAFYVTDDGRYRIDVDAVRNHTTVTVWEGRGTAYGEDAQFPVERGEMVRFFDTTLRDYQVLGVPRVDDFAEFAQVRDGRLQQSVSARYVSPDIVGYADLDDYGSWRRVGSYGHTWFPSRVDAGWAPYRDGRWVWQEPFGWTWIDNAPWGYAPSHYGRWVHVQNRWGWVPGPRRHRAYYAPALVAFVGGNGWSLSIGNAQPVGWFPLGPREVYLPAYRVSQGYFNRVNISNTVVTNINITNVYNNYYSGGRSISQLNYSNRNVRGGVTAVSRDVFVGGGSVRGSALQLDARDLARAQVARTAGYQPQPRSSLVAASARSQPSREVFDRGVVARSRVAPIRTAFTAAEGTQAGGRAAVAPSRAVATPRSAQNIKVLQNERQAVNTRGTGTTRGAAPARDAAARTPAATPRGATSARDAANVRAPASGRAPATGRSASPDKAEAAATRGARDTGRTTPTRSAAESRRQGVPTRDSSAPNVRGGAAASRSAAQRDDRAPAATPRVTPAPNVRDARSATPARVQPAPTGRATPERATPQRATPERRPAEAPSKAEDDRAGRSTAAQRAPVTARQSAPARAAQPSPRPAQIRQATPAQRPAASGRQAAQPARAPTARQAPVRQSAPARQAPVRQQAPARQAPAPQQVRAAPQQRAPATRVQPPAEKSEAVERSTTSRGDRGNAREAAARARRSD